MRIHQNCSAGWFLLLAVACFAPVTLLLGADAPRTAVLDFSWSHAPGGFEPALTDLSRGVQARLLADADHVWIERQEFERISAEADLGRMSGSDAQAAVRLGHLLRADLLLRGELVRAEGSAELRLEAIDPKRAEALAEQVVVLPLSKSQRFHTTATNLAAATAAAQQTLVEARGRLEKQAGVRVVAPLYFKGLGKTSRLGFLEARLTDTLAKAAEADGGLRVLRFARTAEAGEESSLVVGGLTDTTPEAVQQVADTYVWGTFEERDPGGVAFEDVPVVIKVEVWNGSGDPVVVEWNGHVKTVETGLADLVNRTLAAARAPRVGANIDLRQRERIARLLGARALEISAAISPQPEFLKSAAGRQLYALQERLLETACFFDPLNRELQEMRIRVVWSLDNPRQPLLTLRGWWARIADLRTQARKFGHRTDGTVDGMWPALRTDALFEFIRNIKNSERSDDSIPAGKIGYVKQRLRAKMSPEDQHEQLRLTIGLWSELVSETALLTSAEKSEPAWLAPLREKWFDQLEGIHLTTLDPVIFHSFYEKAWPGLMKEVGRRMKQAVEGKRGEPPKLELIRIYSYFGEDTKVDAMLDQAWTAYQDPKVNPPSVAASSSGTTVARARPPRVDKPWAPAPSRNVRAATAPPEAGPILQARFRVIDFKPIQPYYRQPVSAHGDLLQKWTMGSVKQIAWHQGRFWLAEENAELPKGVAAPNPQGNHYLWAYDPVQHTTELITPQLGGHATLTALISDGSNLWLGTAADGVWRLGSKAGEVKRFVDADGLASPRIHSATRVGNELVFVGGEYPDFVVSRYALDTGAWSTIRVPTPEREAKMAAAAKAKGATVQQSVSPHVAVSGDWLCFLPRGLYYQFSTQQWFDPSGKMGAKPPGNLARYNLATADASGFWCGTSVGFKGGAVRLITSDSDTAPKMIRLGDVGLKTMVHHGPWLWVLTESPQRTPGLVLIDKRTQAIVGRLDLPGQEASALWVSDDRLWVGAAAKVGNHTAEEKYGLPALLEIRLAVPRPSGEPAAVEGGVSPPLLAAVRQNDPTVFERALREGGANQASASGYTALMGAVDQGRLDWVERLLAAGAEVNRLASNGESALSLAVRQRDTVLAGILLKHGADSNIRPPTRLFGLTRPQIVTVQEKHTEHPMPQPTELHATINENGYVQLFWDDRATNETGYEISYHNGRSWHRVAEVRANVTTWVDPENRSETELRYNIAATGGAVIDQAARPEVLATLATLATTSRSFMYGLNPNGTALLPPQFVVPPPLSIAAAQGDEAMVKLLLAHRADANQTDSTGGSPLLHALRHREYVTARQLLAAGAQPDLEDGAGVSPLMIVHAAHEDRDLLLALFQALTPEARRRQATAMLPQAATTGQIADLEMLHSLGADLEGSDSQAADLLLKTIASNQVETVRWLWERMPRLQAQWKQGDTGPWTKMIFEQAIRHKNTEFFQMIIDAGCPPDLKMDRDSLSKLAARERALEVLDILKQAGVDLHTSGALALLPPADAARYVDQPDAVLAMRSRPPNQTYFTQEIIRYTGPDTFAYSTDPAKQASNDALLAASVRGDLPAVIQAVADGAQLEASNAQGRTALHEAVRSKAIPVVRWLLEEGAHVDRLSGMGVSALGFAVETGNLELVECLLAARADVNRYGHRSGLSPLALALITKNQPLVIRLLDAGAHPNFMWNNQSNRKLTTPLAAAAWVGQESLFDLLLSRGANPKAQGYRYHYFDTDGGLVRAPEPSTLMYATQGKNVALVKRLVELGQDPKLQVDEGYDALAWAAGAGSREMVEFLLPLSHRTGRALESAERNGHTDIIELLKRAGYQAR